MSSSNEFFDHLTVTDVRGEPNTTRKLLLNESKITNGNKALSFLERTNMCQYFNLK